MNWVSIDDKLPEKEGFYITALKMYTGNPSPYVHVMNWNLGFWTDEDAYTEAQQGVKVTHWMPLPELPYRSEKEAQA